MDVRGSFERVVRASARRPRRVLVIATALALVGAALALLRLEPSAATSTLAGKGSPSFQATERYRERFGDHSIVVLVRGALPQLVLTENLGRLIGLEGCLSGNKPKDKAAPGGPSSPCGKLAATKPVQVVYGPGTFINAAVGEIQDQLQARLQTKAAEAQRAADAARELAKGRGLSKAQQDRYAKSAQQLVYAETVRDLLQLNVKYGLGLTAEPRIDDPDFVSALVFDPAHGASTPKARFAYLFPSKDSAAIQVRLKPGLSDAERGRAIQLIRDAVAMPQWRLRNAGGYTVTGAPVVVEDLADALAASTLRLLVVALIVMAAVLALVFRQSLRLVPLLVALGAVAVLFGLMSLVGAPLTMASIAVLPVLLGLGVDYAIQWQARASEDPPGGPPLRAARIAAPTIATAALATAVGFLVLLLSPVPMVREFGALLVIGVALSLAFALSAGTAALVVGRHRTDGPFARSARGAGELLGAAWRPIGHVLAPVGRLGGKLSGGTVRSALAHPTRFVAVGLVLAAAGWVADSRAEVVSDLNRLVPQDLRAVRDLHTLESTTGIAGEIDVVVEGKDLTEPGAVKWMRDYQAALKKRFGGGVCGRAELCPALSLPDLFRTADSANSRDSIRALLAAVPPYFSQAVITADRKTANLAFGIKLESLERQQQVIDVMRDQLRPPPGVKATVAGLPVLAAEANGQLSSPLRRLGTLAAGLLAVALALLAVYRRWDRAWVPLVPIALATGWSALVLWLIGVPLNPMSATLGALVLAISTEFAVLLVARYREERAAGLQPAEAVARCYRSTGAAVLASGLTAIAGFAVLALSDVKMLQEFGLVTVVDLTVSLLGVLAVLPAVLVIAERRAARARSRSAARLAVPA
jgi:hydrophobe/amphiphile efflux-3 (HAE3) family protein